MISRELLPFAEVWLADFEFGAAPGERPVPRCLVAREYFTGTTIRLWEDELSNRKRPPYAIGERALFVAYYASAEAGCHLALGWQTPINVLDLCVEFRNMTNGLELLSKGRSLLDALTHFGLDAMDAVEKESMRALALRGGQYTATEKQELIDYCESDVDALEKLLPCMLPHINLQQALIRGRYMPAAARMEHEGVPIDVESLTWLRSGLAGAKHALIRRVDMGYRVFDGDMFKRDRFVDWLSRNAIAWPLLSSGHPALDGDTFHQMARIYPAVAPLSALRETLSDLRLADLAVGSDGRNRTLLSAFGSKTSRNQPSNAKFIFGPKVWTRGLIKPPQGYGLAYVDFEQQEFGIAAALSGDEAMVAAYLSGDSYLAFAKQAGAVPDYATKESHKAVREQYKVGALGILYGMEPQSLSIRLNRPLPYGVELLQAHRRLYKRYWRWSDAAVDHGMLLGHLPTVFGWTLHTTRSTKYLTLRNYPMQSNGAEMLRLACIYTTEAGIRVCAPVHDALLVLAPLNELDSVIAETQALMAKASSIVLGGFELRTEVKAVRYPERYQDPRGAELWATIWDLLERPRTTTGA